MIIGVVNAHTEATVHPPVRAAGGGEQEIEANLDTGFNGSLTSLLPWWQALGSGGVLAAW